MYLGSIFLEAAASKKVFEHVLDNLPEMLGSSHTFVKYLRKFWLPKLHKVCCWDETQPRTNNPAEAYHSKLAKAFKK